MVSTGKKIPSNSLTNDFYLSLSKTIYRKISSKPKQQLVENINILHVYLQIAIGNETLSNFQSVNSSSKVTTGFPGGSIVKNLPAQCRRHRFDPWVGKIP